MDRTEFMEMVNRINLFRNRENQVNIIRHQAAPVTKLGTEKYVILLELSVGEDSKSETFKGEYEPKSYDFGDLYMCQKMFFTWVSESIIQKGFDSLIKK